MYTLFIIIIREPVYYFEWGADKQQDTHKNRKVLISNRGAARQLWQAKAKGKERKKEGPKVLTSKSLPFQYPHLYKLF